jgi:hypothetical protein
MKSLIVRRGGSKGVLIDLDSIVSPEKSSGEPSPIETFGDMLPLEKKGKKKSKAT